MFKLILVLSKRFKNSPKHKAICHSLGVATHESRNALQRDKRFCKIGLK